MCRGVSNLFNKTHKSNRYKTLIVKLLCWWCCVRNDDMTSYIPGVGVGSSVYSGSGAPYSPGRSALDGGRLGGSAYSATGRALPYDSASIYGTSPTGLGAPSAYSSSGYGGSTASIYCTSPYKSVSTASYIASTTHGSSAYRPGVYSTSGYISRSSGYSSGTPGYCSIGVAGYSSGAVTGYSSVAGYGSGGGYSRREEHCPGSSRWKLDKLLAERHQVGTQTTQNWTIDEGPCWANSQQNWSINSTHLVRYTVHVHKVGIRS